MSLPGSVDTLVFDSFVTELLVPKLRRGDIVLPDNLPAHQASQIEAVVAEVKAKVLWLPSYSPDFSPIENCWSKVKTLVRGQQPRTASELDVALKEALSAVTTNDIEGWFKHCGY
jgi:transposase